MHIGSSLSEAISQALSRRFPQLVFASGEEPTIEEPPSASFGDLATPVCLKLARQLRQSPLAIAEELAAELREAKLGFIAEITVTPPGYVNFRFDYLALARELFATVSSQGSRYGHLSGSPLGASGKVVIEHTNINPNKAAHIGHLRNACLGDTLARLLRASGYQVEVQNYIDDTGTAVADIVVGFDVLAWPEDERSFDYFCWDLYTAINELYEKEPAHKARQRDVLHAIEEGIGSIAAKARSISSRIVECHLKSMARLGIYYDLLTWESHILQGGFWKHAFTTLQGNQGLVLEQSGPNAGCWVVRLADHPDFAGLENPDKVLVRSNGTATYVAKDIAYQMWKFGVLGRDFHYMPYGLQANGVEVWTSTLDEAAAQETAPERFGHADRVINVIDVRQKYLQDILRVSLEQLGFHEEAANSVHFDYEMVALSAEAARELGVNITSDEEGRGVHAMAGRRGIGVKADDLMDRVVAKAAAEVAARHPEFSPQEATAHGLQIAIAAVRYYMLRYNMNSLIVFEFDEALNMRGNSGPYLQYAHARAHNILERAATAGLPLITEFGGYTPNPSEELLLRRLAELPEAIHKAAQALAPSILTDTAFQLASAFMGFYESSNVVGSPPEVAYFRVNLVIAFKQALANTLELLGIPALNRM